ncbi:hypothetical protein TNCV_2043091 [Trichonephila clavipes]|nr:hypothetical protein TNCV_2043091 [Trichonephila clavipes]
MPIRRNNLPIRRKFQQLKEFERGRITSLRDRGFSYRTIGVRVLRNSSTVIRVWEQCTEEHGTAQKSGSG